MSEVTLTLRYAQRPGAADRIMSLLRRRGFPIAGMTLERTQQPDTGRMTISLGDSAAAEQMCRHLRKLPDVLEVFPGTPETYREYALLRVRCEPADQTELLGHLEAAGARTIRVTASAVTAEIAGAPQQIDALMARLDHFEIDEMARTSGVALRAAEPRIENTDMRGVHMAKVYYDTDADPAIIRSRRIAVIGYGSQGHAHAQNLRDSGCDVRVGLYEGSPSRERAEADGFTVGTVAEVAEWADLISILLPDQYHKRVYEASIRPHLTPGKMLMVAHGFSIHFGQIEPPAGVDVAMVAPKGPGHMLRRLFTEGVGVPALFAVYQDATGRAEATTLSYASAIGSTKAGVLRTTFKEETESDLFGEQAVLCGGLTSLVKAGFETLVEAGYQPELAYFECLHEMKLIVDLMYQGGMAHMRYSISDTAEYGDYVSGPSLIDDRVKGRMREILAEIQDGTFAQRWIAECEAGAPSFAAMRARESRQQIETVGAELRSMMSWLNPTDEKSAAEKKSAAVA